MIIIAGDVVAPPLWKWNSRTSSTKHCKRQNEQAGQAGTVKRAGNEIGVVPEDARSVVAEIELRIEADNRPAEQYTSLRLIVRDVSGELDELWKVDLIQREFTDPRNKLSWR